MNEKKYYPKVLVASPTYEGKDYIFEEHFKCITSFDYLNYDYIYIDNTIGDSYTKKLRMRGAKVVHVPRGEHSREALSNAQNYAFELVRQKDYDYLLFVESDLIPPKDTIQRLLNHYKQVVGASYLIGTEDIKYPCVFVEDFRKDGQRGTRPLNPQEITHFFKYPKLYKVHGLGFGCTMIRRDIIERFNIYDDERYIDKHSDVYFYLSLSRANIPVYVDSSFLVPHYPSKWSLVKDR